MLSYPSCLHFHERTLMATATALGLIAGWPVPVLAVAPEAAPACESLADAASAEVIGRITAALQSRHPDHVTRLFAADAAVKGFASPVIRNDYAGIRDYFLYFLQYEPTLTFEGRTIETGCNFAIDTGTYVWTLKPRGAEATEKHAIPMRYRMTFERVGTTWQISELIEEQRGADTSQITAQFALPAPQPTRAADVARTAPAVAGFIKRNDDAAEATAISAAAKKAERRTREADKTNEDPPAAAEPAHRLQWFEISR